eukprot:2264021-Pyramimonas_sp.AAC.1
MATSMTLCRFSASFFEIRSASSQQLRVEKSFPPVASHMPTGHSAISAKPWTWRVIGKEGG